MNERCILDFEDEEEDINIEFIDDWKFINMITDIWFSNSYINKNLIINCF